METDNTLTHAAAAEIELPSRRFTLGWLNVLAAAAAMVATLPARTVGLGLITEPLIHELGMSRTTYGAINLWATLIGAGFGLAAGRLLDRWGARPVIAGLTLLLGIVVVWLSRVTAPLALFIAVTLTRGLGQSALSAASVALVGKWFVKRAGPAMAVYSVVLSVGFMIAIPAIDAAGRGTSWRHAWGWMGLILAIIVAPLLWLVVRSTPEDAGMHVDGRRTRATAEDDTNNRDDEAKALAGSGYTLRQALATPAFWVLALGGFAFNAAYSGVTLFNESILAERGFGGSPTGPLIVIVFTALAANGVAGWLLSTGVRVTRLMGAATLLLAASLVILPRVHTHAQVLAYAAALGVSAGIVTVTFFACWPRLYGRTHLGRIQGAAQALTVLASPIGPLVLAQALSRTGSYAPAFYGAAAVAGLLGLVSLIVPEPSRGERDTDAN